MRSGGTADQAGPVPGATRLVLIAELDRIDLAHVLPGEAGGQAEDIRSAAADVADTPDPNCSKAIEIDPLRAEDTHFRGGTAEGRVLADLPVGPDDTVAGDNE